MDFSLLGGKKVFITGATGLIGKAVVSYLLTQSFSTPVRVVALVRDEERARRIFSALPCENLEFRVGDVCELNAENIGVDYVIHGASCTESRAFVEQPVEVIKGAIKGTERVLEFARVNHCKGVVYLSTMEIYGNPIREGKIDEQSPSFLDCMRARSSYPESKRLCECLCTAYYSEYSLPVNVIRLTQTFGEGVQYNDRRVFAEFARCAIEAKDIVLKTKGETKRNYLYIDDAVTAILCILLYGDGGQAYNAANEETYCSVYEMARLVADEFGKGRVKVVVEEAEDVLKFGYAPTLKMNLCTKKLQSLGWKPTIGLRESFEKMIKYMKQNKD